MFSSIWPCIGSDWWSPALSHFIIPLLIKSPACTLLPSFTPIGVYISHCLKFSLIQMYILSTTSVNQTSWLYFSAKRSSGTIIFREQLRDCRSVFVLVKTNSGLKLFIADGGGTVAFLWVMLSILLGYCLYLFAHAENWVLLCKWGWAGRLWFTSPIISDKVFRNIKPRGFVALLTLAHPSRRSSLAFGVRCFMLNCRLMLTRWW